MKNWQISCNGWYAYCPECHQESLYRTPVCMNCGALVIPNDEDMSILEQSDTELYDMVMQRYMEVLRNDSHL